MKNHIKAEPEVLEAHKHIIGRSGQGKSYLLKRMIAQDIDRL